MSEEGVTDGVLTPTQPDATATTNNAPTTDTEAEVVLVGPIVDEPQYWTSSATGETFGEAELEICLKVLEILSTDIELFETKDFRPLRVVSNKLLRVDERRDDNSERRKRKHKDQIRQQRRLADDKHRESAKMRAQRLAELQSLIEVPSQPMLLSAEMVPGGDENNPILQLTNNPTDGVVESDSEGEGEGEGECVAAEAPGIEEPREGFTELHYGRSCYICKKKYYLLHHFYDTLCPDCAEFNYEKRLQSADMVGRVCIVTGGRKKIGFNASLKLLRAGADVVVTTRFAHDAAKRFAAVSDFDEWSARLHVVTLDLCDLKAVEAFCDMMYEKFDRLDAIVNNAAQTIRRPAAFYAHLIDYELQDVNKLPPAEASVLMEPGRTLLPARLLARDVAAGEVYTDSTAAAASSSDIDIDDDDDTATTTTNNNSNTNTTNKSGSGEGVVSVAGSEAFPEGALDSYGQQIDLREKNSWTLKLDEVSTEEAMEVHAVNALAPLVLNSKLKGLLVAAGADTDKFIINVSAMEGKFYRHKNDSHPHTNMAKAALNMMTRTSASGYAKDRIYVNSVDTGWINDENAVSKIVQYAANNKFTCPIDEEDAAARILAPIFDALNGTPPVYGLFLKDYRLTEW